MKTKMTLMSTLAEFDSTHTRSGVQTENPDQTETRRNQMPKTTIPLFSFHPRALTAMLVFTVFGSVGEGLAQDQVTHVKDFTVLKVQNSQPAMDFVNAKTMALPINYSPANTTQDTIQALQSAPDLGSHGYASGATGNGKQSPVFLGTPAAAPAESGVTPEDWGTNNHPFTTAKADLYGLVTQNNYPYRAAGKLFFNIGSSGFICSASMIKRGIVVTAAHCVANYGQSQFYNGWQFVPAYLNGLAPYGTWTAAQVWIKTAYFNGTDGCAVFGVVCPDDVAVIILNTQNGAYAGTNTGWFGYWYGGGFTSNGITQLTQLGYPAGLDNARYMERNDSYGYISPSNSNNTVIGSNMNGGSSGGPWVGNFGLPPQLTGETNGSFSPTNVIMGVTSWGYTSTAPKEQGAAPFTSNNIQSLLNSACASVAAACQ
jgi:V8-like Glu-specific endopeptidase